MAIPLAHYVTIKDNYCIAYMGDDTTALKKLIEARPRLEETYSGIKIYISAKAGMFEGTQATRLMTLEHLQMRKQQLAYIRLIWDVDEFLQESEAGA